MTLDWWTLALQVINFLVLVWLLQRFLYKPALAIIAKRKELVEQAFDEADQAKAAAAAAQQKFEDGQAQLPQARQELMQRTHSELEDERKQILEDARAEAASMLDGARQQIEAERHIALENSKAEVAGIAVDMAANLLRQISAGPGNAVDLQPALTDSFLGQLLERLEELPEEDRQAMIRDVADSTEGLCVVTSTALSEAEQSRWRDEIARRLGASEKVSFQADPEILGGVELRFPHAVLSLSWSELLRQGREALLADETTV